ncbi:unnamed protein product [Miscanthus lutarioriparius]|uniref:Uncharacterized protein n=1 Tax=Miscanthus lutarioriparius TaxID=422564 RepID=A0A811RBQ5_9POAL|nr:unnamed protein product [Miscanthus lutarioriparius]
MAFHPEFMTNGRFFVSYNCDSSTSPVCGAGTCWGSAAEMAPSCAGNSRLFIRSEEDLHHGFALPAHIIFLPASWRTDPVRPSDSDGYLYLVTGNGDFSKKREEKTDGQVTVPLEIEKPEIFAAGLNNPNGCSFDSNRPAYLYCADVNEEQQAQRLCSGPHRQVLQEQPCALQWLHRHHWACAVLDAFVLATRGVFRLVPPSLCGVTQPLPQPARGAGWVLSVLGYALLFALYLVWMTVFGGGGQIKRSCNECFREISCCTFYFWGTRKRSARITKKKRVRWTWELAA